MKRILLFGAGKSATCLIDYLLRQSAIHDWELVVADSNRDLAAEKTGGSPHARALGLQVENGGARMALIEEADLVISLLPPALHHLVAGDCLRLHKHLLTASYIDEKISALRGEIEKQGLFFLCEMGLDPGIDHMSAMEIIHRLHGEGAAIHSFRSHTGGLIAPESDNNPWHYKISWNPRNVVLAGKDGAVYLRNGQQVKTGYAEIFASCEKLLIPGMGELAFYPNRDSLSYIPVYGLGEATTFIRTTLRYPSFCENWNLVIRAGLTDDRLALPAGNLRFRDWSKPILPWIKPDNEAAFRWLGLFGEEFLPAGCRHSADVLQYLLETRLAMQEEDRDMIVMMHEFGYTLRGQAQNLKSVFIVKGEDMHRTAMAKTVGLPLGIAARLILEGQIRLTGLHIPILPEIYEPVLRELRAEGISFREELS